MKRRMTKKGNRNGVTRRMHKSHAVDFTDDRMEMLTGKQFLPARKKLPQERAEAVG